MNIIFRNADNVEEVIFTVRECEQLPFEDDYVEFKTGDTTNLYVVKKRAFSYIANPKPVNFCTIYITHKLTKN